MKKLKLARKFIESQGGFVTTRTHVQCIFCDQSVAISEMGSACPLCGHEYTIEDIQKAMRRPTTHAADAKGSCPTCNDTGYIIDGGEVWGACDCKRLPLRR